MTEPDLRALFTAFGDALNRHDWPALAEVLHPDCTLEYPQSGEKFIGRDNIRAQFENYPSLEPGSTHVEEVIGETRYAVSPMFTIIEVEGAGQVGTGVTRVHYPDGSLWWAINVFEKRGPLLYRMRTFFAPDFPAPDWRAPYREPLTDTSESDR